MYYLELCGVDGDVEAIEGYGDESTFCFNQTTH